jgi:hypothetical protein
MTRIMLIPALCRTGSNSATNRGVCDGDVDTRSIGAESDVARKLVPWWGIIVCVLIGLWCSRLAIYIAKFIRRWAWFLMS